MFNPTQFLPLANDISPVPRHGRSWTEKYSNWWGGATIASPTMGVVAPAKQSIKAVRRFQTDLKRLLAYYHQDMEYSRSLVRMLLQLEDTTPVIFEASGTSAIMLASRIFAHICRDAQSFFTVTTDEGGSLVPATLKGRNPNEIEKTMFQPAASLFYEPDPVLPYPQGLKPESRLIGLNHHGNTSLVQAIKTAVRDLSQSGTVPGCVLLPQVSKTGRILPVREVAAALAELRGEGVAVYLIVDAIQSIGRVAAEEIVDPLSLCDAFVFGSSKALGGLLIASTVIIKRQLLDQFLDAAQAGKLATGAFASHFQFEPADESRLPQSMLKAGAISIPEVVAMREAVRLHYLRGEGATFSARRQWQLELGRKLRAKLIDALATIPGIEILKGDPDRPIVDSIVCFKPPQNWSPAAFKDALQEGHPIVTPSASIGRYVRLDIPEYRDMPSVSVLVAKIRKILLPA